ncbi:MAG: hypothetical protein IE916_00155 [Epsilonproteobacteria bacterium]|nr:hypothetical protein [Campylobacterota bacterium]
MLKGILKKTLKPLGTVRNAMVYDACEQRFGGNLRERGFDDIHNNTVGLHSLLLLVLIAVTGIIAVFLLFAKNDPGLRQYVSDFSLFVVPLVMALLYFAAKVSIGWEINRLIGPILLDNFPELSESEKDNELKKYLPRALESALEHNVNDDQFAHFIRGKIAELKEKDEMEINKVVSRVNG